MTANNPFSLIFSLPPHLMIPRLRESNLLLDYLNSAVPSTQAYLITGVRATGKTVLMTDISHKISEDPTWLRVTLNPELDMVRSLYEMLSNQLFYEQTDRGANLNPLTCLPDDSEGREKDLQTALIGLLKQLKARRQKVLIDIDEATDSRLMLDFTSTFDLLLKERLPVFLLMTGLRDNLQKLLHKQSQTFLSQTPCVILGPLNTGTISESYQQVLNLDLNTALAMAKLTRGYAYAYQLLGYLCWENPGDYQAIIPQFRQYLEEYVYEKIWSELSHKDKQLAAAIARCDDGRIATIRAALDVDTNAFNPYRQRLINRGLVNGEERGFLRFTLPLFERFVLEQDQF